MRQVPFVVDKLASSDRQLFINASQREFVDRKISELYDKYGKDPRDAELLADATRTRLRVFMGANGAAAETRPLLYGGGLDAPDDIKAGDCPKIETLTDADGWLGDYIHGRHVRITWRL